MPSKKDPAFLFYPSDFIMGTLTMTDDQVGKYIRILCLQHSKGGKISEKDIMKITHEYDEEIFDKFEQDEDGLYFNDRLLNEMTKRKEYSESRRKNKMSKTYVKDMSNICESHDEHMENTNINVIKDLNKKDFKEEKEGVEEKETKHKYGEYKHVLLKDSEYSKLKNDFGNVDELIDYLDKWIEEHPTYKSKSHNLAIRRWVVDAVEKRKQNKGDGKGEYDKGRKGNTYLPGEIGTII